LESLLASSQIKPIDTPSQEGRISLESSADTCPNPESTLNLDSSVNTSEAERENEYLQLQLQIFKIALLLTAFAVIISTIFFDLKVAFSVLIGSFSGILYLRLLGRGIGKLGKTSMSVSKIQLLVPVLLFFLASRFPQLELWPALLGFLLYKPSLIVQFLLKP